MPEQTTTDYTPLFSAKGAVSLVRLGHRPGIQISVKTSAEGAFQSRNHIELMLAVSRAFSPESFRGCARLLVTMRLRRNYPCNPCYPWLRGAYAAGKRTTFFFALMANAPFAAGKKVSSTYFLAQATRSRLQLRSSLRLMFSRWLSIVFTLR